jgi:hypothetical protein
MEASVLSGLILAAAAAGAARGFSGFGAALIFMPPAAALVGPQTAAATLLITDLLMSSPMIPQALPYVSKREIALLTLGAVPALPLGAWALRVLDPLVLRWIIVLLAATMLLLLMSGWRYRGRPHGLLTTLVGALSGLGSGIAQIGGPPVVAYLLGGSSNARALRATTVIYFFVSGLIAGVSFYVARLFTQEVLFAVLAAAPSYGLGLVAGSRMFGIASEATFRRVCFGLIAIALVVSAPIW